VIRPLVSDLRSAGVTERLLRLRGHGVTRLADALKAAREQLASARTPRRVVILLPDCRSTDDNTLDVARGPARACHPGPGRRSRAGRAPGRAGGHPLGAAATLDGPLDPDLSMRHDQAARPGAAWLRRPRVIRAGRPARAAAMPRHPC
jgi:hypothetical protein